MADWYLSKVVVVDLQTDKWYLFVCEEWLSLERGIGSLEFVLHPTTKEDNDGSIDKVLTNNIKKKLFDDHLWLSIGYRKTRSTFTRVQRLSCCLAILYLTMVSNAMFYGTADVNSAQSAITIGPISITVHQLYTSLISSLIVVPPILIISTIFAKRDTDRKLKKKHYKSKASTSNEANLVRNVANKKKRRKLPYWFVFVAYLLVFLSVACGAFFTILYAFEWGKAKSEAWLVTFLMSFVQSVLLIQPLKVIVVAALISFLLKKDTDVEIYEEKIGQMEPVGKDIKPANKEINHVSKQLSEKEIRELEKNQTLNKKMSGLVREILWDILFLFLLILVVMGNQNSSVYYQNKDLRNTFLTGLTSVYTSNDTWKWVRKVLLPGLYYTTAYNLMPASEYDQKFISNGYAMRLGPPRLRQLRVSPALCEIPDVLQRLHNICLSPLTENTEDRNSYNISWLPRVNSHGNSTPIIYKPLEMSYQYQSEAELNGLDYWGYFQWYGGGGYVANLGNSLPEAENLIGQLETTGWIDKYTRVVLVEFNVWNANSNMFNLFVLTFEFPAEGGVFNWMTIDSVNLYRYTGAGGLLNLLAEVIMTLYIIVITILEIRKVVKSRGKHLKLSWNVVLMFCLVCYYAAMGVYAWRSVITTNKVEEMMNNREKSINFQLLVTSNIVFMSMMGLICFLMEIRLLHTLRYVKSISVMKQTLRKAVKDLFNVYFGFGTVFMGFISLLYISYQSRLFQYRSFAASAKFLTTVFFGTNLNFSEVVQETGTFGAVVFLSYMMMMLMLWMNVFIAVLNDYMNVVQSDEEFQSLDYQVIQHTWNKFSKMLQFSENKVVPKKDSEELPVTTSNKRAKTSIDKYKTPSIKEFSLPASDWKPRLTAPDKDSELHIQLQKDLDQLFGTSDIYLYSDPVSESSTSQRKKSTVSEIGMNHLCVTTDSGISSIVSSHNDLTLFKHTG